MSKQLTDEEKITVLDILNTHLSDTKFWAFGSRVKNTAKNYADLDIAIIQDTLVDLLILSSLEEDFANSNFSFKVDIIDWQRISPEFRSIIQSDYIAMI